jgi:type II secretory pathway pseudopilin PulG
MTLRRRRGFALIWALVMIAILAAIAAAVVPVLGSIADQQRVTATLATLNSLDTAIIRFGLVVKRTGGVAVYPGALHELSTVVLTTDQVSCQNNAMAANGVTTWTTGGPFVTFFVPPAGVTTPMGTITDVIPTRTQNAAFLINMPNVDFNLAQLLDLLVDGTTVNQGTTGRILWGAVSGTNTVTLQYSVGLQPGFLRVANQC